MADQRRTGPPQPDKPFEPVVSSGGLIFNDDGKILILRRKIEKNWVLPKGKQEAGETLEENALREVEEETGISNLEIDRHIGLVRYVFHWFPDEVNYIKTVHYFLMKVQGEPEVNTETEFSEHKWASYEEAVKILKHENDRLIARKGFEMVETDA